MPDEISLGDLIKKHRRRSALTQEELIDWISTKHGLIFDSATISRYENDKRKADRSTLLAVMSAFVEHESLVGSEKEIRQEFDRALDLAGFAAVKDDEVERYIRQFLQPEEPEIVETPQTTFSEIVQELTLMREYTPLETLPFDKPTDSLIQAFAFGGIEWSQIFAFPVGLVRADHLDLTEIESQVSMFQTIANEIQKKSRRLIDVPKIVLTITGVVVFVFEDGIANSKLAEASALQGLDGITYVLNELDELKFEASTYQKPIFGIGFYDAPTILVWAVDLKTKRIFREIGKKSITATLYIYNTRKATEKLAKLLRQCIDVAAAN